MLEVAKTNLRDHFAAVGITERFDASVLLMAQVSGWRDPFYVSQKVTRSRPARGEVPATTVDLIAGYNTLDSELYAFGLELHERAVRAAGPPFQARLEIFQRLNADLGQRQAKLSDPSPLAMLAAAHAGCLQRKPNRSVRPSSLVAALRGASWSSRAALAAVLFAAALLLLVAGVALGVALS
jgi:hypothetical protein